MSQKTIRRLKKTLLQKTPEVLMLLRKEYGERTSEMETPERIWRNFKKLYKQGKVPKEMIWKYEKKRKETKTNDNNPSPISRGV